ncbi:MAG: single-stranded-DNA-specific exonuclease RecJ [Bacillota bacterium]
MMNKWMLKRAAFDPKKLVKQKAELPLLLAQLLAVRGYDDVQDISRFLQIDQPSLASPFLFKDMDKALSIIADAVKNKRKIIIFGDYDADGIMSTVILSKTLSKLGADPDFYIPQRDSEGYGLNNDALKSLHESGAEIILACDLGISNLAEVDFANSLGLKVVIIDHHSITLAEDDNSELIPHAAAVVDPKQADCAYPFKLYCAAGLCLRFSEALFGYLNLEWAELEEELLSFATIATICDLVDLVEDNRCLVKKGLPKLAATKNYGLRALISLTGLEGKEITVYHVGFIIGPCINASGRLKEGSLAVELFLTKDPQKAYDLASYLVELNTSRKKITAEGTSLAIKKVEKTQLHKQKVIVLHCPEVNESVAGIVAGRVKEYFYRPTIIITGTEDILRGSCRSIEGYDIFQALSACRELFTAFGGHPMAAGLSIHKSNLPALSECLNRDCPLSTEEMIPVVRIDKQFPLHLPTKGTAELLEIMEPYGKGNDKPLFVDKEVLVEKISFMGKTGQVMKFFCRTRDRYKAVELISFNHKDQLEKLIVQEFDDALWQNVLQKNTFGRYLDFIYTIGINEFNGQSYLQLQVIDFRLSQNQGK